MADHVDLRGSPDDGWERVDDLLSPVDATDLAARCVEVAASLTDPRSGDKPHGATLRLTALDERLPETIRLLDALTPALDRRLPDGWRCTEIAFRSPGPGTGEQRLHADNLPRTDIGPCTGATAIVALVDVDRHNGATRVVPGSHRRPDLQRHSQRVEHLPGEVWLAGRAGTAWVFSRHLLHAGSRNASASSRPVLQLSFEAVGASRSPTGGVVAPAR